MIDKHNIQREVDYPSVFGSGSQRFQHGKLLESPGPGYYSPERLDESPQKPVKPHGRSKKSMKKYIPAARDHSISAQEIGIDLRPVNYYAAISKSQLTGDKLHHASIDQSGTRAHQRSGVLPGERNRLRGSSCFESDSVRFDNYKSQSQIGPG